MPDQAVLHSPFLSLHKPYLFMKATAVGTDSLHICFHYGCLRYCLHIVSQQQQHHHHHYQLQQKKLLRQNLACVVGHVQYHTSQSFTHNYPITLHSNTLYSLTYLITP